MKIAIAAIGLGAMCLVGTVHAQQASKYSSPKQQLSYAIGFRVGQGLAQNKEELQLDLDVAAVKQAIEDVLTGKAPQVPAETMQAVLVAHRQKLVQKHQVQADKNKAAGDKFRGENKAKSGVKVTKSGLQYKVLKEGKGKKPAEKDTVVVHYKGALIDGKEFDSSYKRKNPATLSLVNVIKGWQEGLQLMSAGSKMQFVIPPELGYGDQGAPRGGIGPNATLVFEVELIEVK